MNASLTAKFDHGTTFSTSMKHKKALLIGCGSAAFVAVAVLVALVYFLIYVSKDVEGMEISINGPTEVAIGATFELEVLG